MAKDDDIDKRKAKFLLKREAALKRKVEALEIKLFEQIFEDVVARMEVDAAGNLLPNAKNVALVNELDALFTKFNVTSQASVVNGFAVDLAAISGLNQQYFNAIESDAAKLERIAKKTKRIMFDRLGLDKKGELKSKGFLTDFIKDTSTKNKVKSAAFNAVSGRAAFMDFKSQLRQLVTTTDTNGILNAHFQTFAYDTYQEYNRTESELYARELNLQAFVYQGGKIATTRKFCCQRNNKVWLRDEAQKWSRRFGGNKNGNILTVLGGYNCRHNTRFISNEKAARMRPDLEQDEDGELQYKEGVKRQRLNKCS